MVHRLQSLNQVPVPHSGNERVNSRVEVLFLAHTDSSLAFINLEQSRTIANHEQRIASSIRQPPTLEMLSMLNELLDSFGITLPLLHDEHIDLDGRRIDKLLVSRMQS